MFQIFPGVLRDLAVSEPAEAHYMPLRRFRSTKTPFNFVPKTRLPFVLRSSNGKCVLQALYCKVVSESELIVQSFIWKYCVQMCASLSYKAVLGNILWKSCNTK